MNTLVAATIPLCNTLILSAKWRTGLKSMFISNIKDIIKPKVTSPPKSIFKPPYQTIAPNDSALIISITGKKIEKCQIARMVACLKVAFTLLKFSNSASSLLKIWTIFIPEICSWTKVLSLDMADRSSSKALFMAVWKYLVAQIRIGNTANEIQLSITLRENIHDTINTILNISLKITSIPCEKISAIVSISDTTLVTNAPIGVSSKYFKRNESNFSKRFLRISFITDCPIQFAAYIKTNWKTASKNSKPTIIKQ